MDPLADLFAPAALVLLMAVVGTDLRRQDLLQVLRRPWPAVVLTVAQVLLLPLLASGAIVAFRLQGWMALSLLLVAASPGGALSNIYSYLARANVALSVTLTALSTLASPLSLPLAIRLGERLLEDAGPEVEIPVVRLIAQLVCFVAAPVLFGMRVRARHPSWVRQRQALLRRLSLLVTVALVVAVLVARGAPAWGDLPQVVGATALFTMAAAGAGYGIGLLVPGSPAADRRTAAFEFAARNLVIAGIVALSALDRPEPLGFAALALLVQAPILLALARLWGGGRTTPAQGIGGG